MGDRIDDLQVLLVVRNQRMNGPTSSEAINDTIEELAHDLAGIADQWNNRLVPVMDGLPDGSVTTSVDAFLNGLDGQNMYVDQNASATSNSSYYSAGYGRPQTVFEQFESIYTSIADLQEDLENQISSLAVTASQIAIEDGGNLYAASNVEAALAEAMVKIDLVASLNFSNVSENILPSADDTYDLGSSSLRWRNLYLGPSSLYIVATAAEAGGTSRSYKFSVDGTSGAFVLKEGATEIFSVSADGVVAATKMQQYISVSLTADNTGQTTEFNPFDTTTNGGTAVTNASQGITYSSSTGRFTVAYAGTYKVDIVAYVNQNSTSPLDVFKLRKNDTTDILDASGVHSYTGIGPVERTISIVVDLAASDYLELKVDSNSTSTAECHNGSTFNMMRIK